MTCCVALTRSPKWSWHQSAEYSQPQSSSMVTTVMLSVLPASSAPLMMASAAALASAWPLLVACCVCSKGSTHRCTHRIACQPTALHMWPHALAGPVCAAEARYAAVLQGSMQASQ